MDEGMQQGETDKTPEQLVQLIRTALVKKGVRFGEKVGLENVLAAALDHIESGGVGVAAATARPHGHGAPTYGTTRDQVLQTAMAEVNSSDGELMVCTATDYVNGALKEKGFASMTDGELRELPLENTKPKDSIYMKY